MPKTSFHSYTTGAAMLQPAAPVLDASSPWKTWKDTPTSSNFQAMANDASDIVDAAVRNAGGDGDELRIPALKLLRKAAQSYDPSRGASFKTHAFNQLKSLQRTRWEREFMLHTPERARILQGRLSGFKREFEAENGRQPEDDETFQALGVTERQANRAATSAPETTESAAEGAFGSSAPAINESDNDLMMEALYEDAAADEDRLGQAIIKHYFGYRRAPLYSQTDIARAYSVSPVAVHKRIKKLKTLLGDTGGLK